MDSVTWVCGELDAEHRRELARRLSVKRMAKEALEDCGRPVPEALEREVAELRDRLQVRGSGK